MADDGSALLQEHIDYQMNGLMHAMVELALASHPNDEGVYDRDFIQLLLNTMPRHCPYPCSLSPALTRQYRFDRHITLADVYDATGMRPNPPAHIRSLDEATLANLFIGIAARAPRHDNELFQEERRLLGLDS